MQKHFDASAKGSTSCKEKKTSEVDKETKTRYFVGDILETGGKFGALRKEGFLSIEAGQKFELDRDVDARVYEIFSSVQLLDIGGKRGRQASHQAFWAALVLAK